MSNETFVLTNADMNAVVLKDAGYINRRGAKLYVGVITGSLLSITGWRRQWGI